MSGDERMVLMNADQADFLNELTERAIREDDSRAMWLRMLVIAYKFAPPLAPPLPDNVRQIDRGGTEGAPPPRGAQHSLPRRRVSDAVAPPADKRPSASVVPLDTHSRRVPCS